jgi:16S rRNA (cytosine967-C5)-methyltransferase
LCHGLDKNGIDAEFGSTPYAPSALTPAETDLIGKLEGRSLEDPKQPDGVRYEFPAWLEEPLQRHFGENLSAELNALNKPAPVDLRVNTLKTTREELLEALTTEGLSVEPTPRSPNGIRITGNPNATRTRLFKDGLFEIQDEGSQLASFLVDARPGMTVIDYCAGGGGKSLALVNTMLDNNRFDGQLWACDVSETRLGELEKRAIRNGVIEAINTHVITDNDAWLTDNVGLADRVLADVPCSGSGAWRREPENRWRLTPESLGDLIARQQDILDRASTLVKSGGRLVYVTCSIVPGENEEQIEWFLAKHTEFSLMPIAEIWQNTIGGAPTAPNEMLRLSPATTNTDGFFIAVLQKH